MDITTFNSYVAKLYGREIADPLVVNACQMAVNSFSGTRPWSFTCANTTKTANSSGIITFDEDFDGVITMRENTSSSGGWIQVWPVEKFDWEVPRLDNLTGSYPKVCKVYYEDGEWKGQLAPPVAVDVYITYKKDITNIADIPAKFIPGLVAYANFFMTTPVQAEHGMAEVILTKIIKKLWREDRRSWASLFRMFDEAEVRRYVNWWGPWDW
ncbi:MAG: hypothetical protein WC356_03825 [Candidatus Micrarchaeia archaeon]|jgi:hypothetical protein